LPVIDFLMLFRLGVDRPHKQTRQERFLAEMGIMVSWTAVSALIEPHYLSGEPGGSQIGIECMLRIHFLQHQVTDS
jgi:hypothetical protein